MLKLTKIVLFALIIGINAFGEKGLDQNEALLFKSISYELNFKLAKYKTHLEQGTADGIIIEEEGAAEDLGFNNYSFRKTTGFYLSVVNNQPRKKLNTDSFIIFEADNSPPAS